MQQVGMPHGLRFVRKLPQGDRSEVLLAQYTGQGSECLVAARKISVDMASKGGLALLDAGYLSHQLEHQNIIGVKGIIELDDAFWLLTEPIDGPSLRQVIGNRIQSNRSLSSATVLQMVRPICQALIYGHSLARDEDGEHLHVPHGSLRPERILIASNGRVRVSDYWLGWVEDSLSGSVACQYLSPEVAGGGPPSALSDQFGLGLLLFELATKSPLIEESNHRKARKALVSGAYRERLSLLGDLGVAPELIEVIDVCLAIAPRGRFPDVKAVSLALRRVQTRLESDGAGPIQSGGPKSSGLKGSIEPEVLQQPEVFPEPAVFPEPEVLGDPETLEPYGKQPSAHYSTAETQQVGGDSMAAPPPVQIEEDLSVVETQTLDSESPEDWPDEDDEAIEVSGWWEIPDLSVPSSPSPALEDMPLEIDPEFRSQMRKRSAKGLFLMLVLVGLAAAAVYQFNRLSSAEVSFRIERMENHLGVLPSGTDEQRLTQLEALSGVTREGDVQFRAEHLELEISEVLSQVQVSQNIMDAYWPDETSPNWPILPRLVRLENRLLGQSRPQVAPGERALSLVKRYAYLTAAMKGRALMVEARSRCYGHEAIVGCSTMEKVVSDGEVAVASEKSSSDETSAEPLPQDLEIQQSPRMPFNAARTFRERLADLDQLTARSWQSRQGESLLIKTLPKAPESRLALLDRE